MTRIRTVVSTPAGSGASRSSEPLSTFGDPYPGTTVETMVPIVGSVTTLTPTSLAD